MSAQSSERFRRADAVFDAALDLAPEEQDAFVDDACRDDAELRGDVHRLLSAHRGAGGFLASPAARYASPLFADAGVLDDPAAPAPLRIGPFRVVRELGRGGMGTVYLAERDDGQFRQSVALKLVRQVGAGEDAVRRFVEERRILALLDHPRIARLVDGGVIGDGHPWFAMELVGGERIDDFCDSHALSIERRLELFRDVCEAVQYAHQHLVIHRDLKPSNILVTAGGRGQVKLLDFGVAKLLDPVAPDSSVTLTGGLPMTPQYAAPEQVRGEPASTAADIYALGVLLYTLLTGRRPYEVRGRSPAEIERIVCEVEPPRPSSAFEPEHERADRIARATTRRGTPERLGRQLRGDLDAITLMALRKEPARRYASVERLAQDVQRYLERAPVLAHRGSWRYRLGKLVRRYRVETVAALAVASSLVLGAAFSTWQARQAERARVRAEMSSRESEAVTQFLLGLFEASDPTDARGDSLMARDLLRRGVARADRLGGQPAVQARMLEVTGRVYLSLGRYADAHALIVRALTLRRSGGERDSAAIARTLSLLTESLVDLGRYAAADSVGREALAIEERTMGAAHPGLAATLHMVGRLAVYRGDLTRAEAHHRRALEVRRRTLGTGDSLTAISHLLLGAALRHRGRMAEAEQEIRLALAVFEGSRGSADGALADATLQLAYLIDRHPARQAEAERLYRSAVDIRRRVFGDAHPQLLYAIGDLAHFLAERGDHETAIPLSRQRAAMLRLAYGAEHPSVITATSQLADLLRRAGQLEEAEGLYRWALSREQMVNGRMHARVAGHATGLARLLLDRGRYAEAESLVRDAFAIREQAVGPAHPNTATTLGLLGAVLTRAGNLAAADSVLRIADEKLARQVAPEHPDVREVYGWLADLRVAQGRDGDAARYRGMATPR